MTKQVKYTIGIVLFCEFLICLGMSLIYPVMPFIRNEYHFSAFDMGMMSSLFALVQFVASPMVGRLSDRIGRKPILVWGLVVFALAEFVFAATNQLWLFDLSRAIDGLSAAMFIPTSMALAADITTKEQRARVIGLLSAAFSGGLMLGPGLGGLLANISYKMPFWAAGVLGLMSALIAVFALPADSEEHFLDQSECAEAELASSSWAQVKQMLTPALVVLFIMILVSAFGLAGFESIYSLYVNQVHHFDLTMIAMVLTVNGVLSLLLQAFLFDRMVLWWGEVRIIRWSFFAAMIGTLIVIYDHSHWQLFIATLIVYEGFDMLRPAITTLLTKMSSSNQGLLNGINMSLTSVGNIVGPLLAGGLLDMNTQAPYLLVAVIMLISFLITFAVSRQIRMVE